MMTLTSAQAALITWTFQDVSLSDGGEVFGSFDYDATTNVFTNVNVTSTSGNAATGDTYVLASNFAFSSRLDFLTSNAIDLTGAGALGVDLFANMTDLGGQIDLDLSRQSFEAICADADCNGFFIERSFSSGFITTTPASEVPAPAAFWFIGLGVVAYWVARKKRATT